MIGEVLRLVPRQVWIVGALAVGVGLHVWHARVQVRDAIDDAVVADRAKWQEQARRELDAAKIEALELGTKAAGANLEIVYELSNQRDLARAVTARTAGQLDGLRSDLAAMRRGQGAAGQGAGSRSLADVAPALANGLEQCAERYSAVEGTARSLSTQVMGLQAYIDTVIRPLGVIAEPQ